MKTTRTEILTAARNAACWIMGVAAFLLIFSEEAPGTSLEALAWEKAYGVALALLTAALIKHGRRWQQALERALDEAAAPEE